MNAKNLTLLVVGLLLAATACNRTISPEVAAREIQARYTTLDQALASKNLPAYMEPFASDAQMQLRNGTRLARAQVEQTMSDLFRTARVIKSATRVRECTVNGTQATVVADSTFSGDFPDAHNARHQVEASSSMRDVWQKQGAVWRMIASVETEHQTTDNGKRVTLPRRQ